MKIENVKCRIQRRSRWKFGSCIIKFNEFCLKCGEMAGGFYLNRLFLFKTVKNCTVILLRKFSLVLFFKTKPKLNITQWCENLNVPNCEVYIRRNPFSSDIHLSYIDRGARKNDSPPRALAGVWSWSSQLAIVIQ